MNRLILILFFVISCTKAGTPSVNVTVPVANNTVEQKEEPEVKPSQEPLNKLPDYPAQPILKGTPSPENGILFSPRHSAEVALNKAELDKLIIENKIISQTREKEIALLEEYNKKLEKELVESKKRSWWDKHGQETMFSLGVTTGIGICLAIFKTSVKIVNKGEQNQ